MKAVLLAAGLGRRLRPLTLTTPKCLVPIGGVPLLEIWLRRLERFGVKQALINLHYMKADVLEFLQTYRGGMNVSTVDEPELLGSLGTLIANTDYYRDEESILVAYADNLTDIDLGELMSRHASHDLPITMAVFRAENPAECGIAHIDETGLVTEFVEKPSKPRSDLANAGVYVIRTDALRGVCFQRGRVLDIGFDLLPRFVGEMAAYPIDGYLIDIGDLAKYQRANEYFERNRADFL